MAEIFEIEEAPVQQAMSQNNEKGSSDKNDKP